MIVANHPTGLLDGIALGGTLPRARGDFRFLANAVLENFPELVPVSFFVDPFGGKAAARRNVAAMKAALEWLRQGKVLVTFPAGEVAHFELKQGRVCEPAWSASIVRLAQSAKAPVVPVFCTGTNSPLFHLAGIVHPRLRTLLLPRELMNKQDRRMELRIGTPLSAQRIAAGDAADLAAYLRRRTMLLAKRDARLSGRSSSARLQQKCLSRSSTRTCEDLRPRVCWWIAVSIRCGSRTAAKFRTSFAKSRVCVSLRSVRRVRAQAPAPTPTSSIPDTCICSFGIPKRARSLGPIESGRPT
ncbi:MAG: lysophospholipid acyltransferase family protein [Bryobacterales bacterium]|nr:lysophospholipid acyltransferase family protein [Bryobacterales bacterium]